MMGGMPLQERFFPESRFGGFTRVDGTMAFYTRVHALLRPEMTVVDFGCGRGAYQDDPVPARRELRILRGKVRQVIGLDISSAGERNPFLDRFHRLDPDHPVWPLESDSADMVICDQVLEHLLDPESFFTEASRVLKSGGTLCIRTSNRWGYVGLASRLLPYRYHARLLAWVKQGTREEDVFPAYYRCSTLPALRRTLARHGFHAAVYGFEPEPAYLAFSGLAYWLGLQYGRLVPEALRSVVFAFGCLDKN